MKTLSIDTQLSKIYTNHCIRHSVVEKLDENNFEARHIMAQTGHKLESSIRAYTTQCPTKKKCEMSKYLASNLENLPAKVPRNLMT